MATLQITIPNNKIELLKNALGYQDQLEQINEAGEIVTINNPQTPKQFAEEVILNYLKTAVRNYERNEAVKSTVHTDIESE